MVKDPCRQSLKKEKKLYRRYFIRNIPSALRLKFFHRAKKVEVFNGVSGITLEHTDEVLKRFILAGQPFAAIHLGGTELGCLNNYEKIRLGLKQTYKKSVRYSMKVNAGFFPCDDKNLTLYAQTWLSECPQADVLGLLGFHMEDYFQAKYLPQAELVLYEGMEPLRGTWSRYLKGKKVLVVSPFVEEIKSQYARRDLLFADDPDILPEFSLSLVKSPLTLGDEKPLDPTFFDALEKIKEAIRASDFEIALVGAGAYTTLLCLYIKSLGKMAIQTGGSTQTLFGIMGKRWEDRPHVAKHVNQYWIRPYKKARGYDKIDKGAYW